MSILEERGQVGLHTLLEVLTQSFEGRSRSFANLRLSALLKIPLICFEKVSTTQRKNFLCPGPDHPNG